MKNLLPRKSDKIQTNSLFVAAFTMVATSMGGLTMMAVWWLRDSLPTWGVLVVQQDTLTVDATTLASVAFFAAVLMWYSKERSE